MGCRIGLDNILTLRGYRFLQRETLWHNLCLAPILSKEHGKERHLLLLESENSDRILTTFTPRLPFSPHEHFYSITASSSLHHEILTPAFKPTNQISTCHDPSACKPRSVQVYKNYAHKTQNTTDSQPIHLQPIPNSSLSITTNTNAMRKQRTLTHLQYLFESDRVNTRTHTHT